MSTKSPALEAMKTRYNGLLDEIDQAFDQAAKDGEYKVGGEDGGMKGAIFERTKEAQRLLEQIKQAEEFETARAGLKKLDVGGGTAKPEPGTQVPGGGDGATGRPATQKSLGAVFVDDIVRPLIKQFGDSAGELPKSLKGFRSEILQIEGGFFPEDRKALVLSTSMGSDTFILPDRQAGVMDLQKLRPLFLRQLVTNLNTGGEKVEWVVKLSTGRTNNAAPVPEATQSGAIGSGSPAITTTTGGVKPQSAIGTWEVRSADVVTIATWIPVTKRVLADAPQISSIIDTDLLRMIDEELEDQMINGDGTGENFLGILNTPGIQTYDMSDNSVTVDVDALLGAIMKVRQKQRRADRLVIDPVDWYSDGFVMAKDEMGRYLFADPTVDPEQTLRIWGLTPVVTEAAEATKPLIFDSNYVRLWNRQAGTISATDSHEDYFVRNLVAVLAEGRWAFAVTDPEAVCKVQP